MSNQNNTTPAKKKTAKKGLSFEEQVQLKMKAGLSRQMAEDVVKRQNAANKEDKG